jgi:hypothetical protein
MGKSGAAAPHVTGATRPLDLDRAKAARGAGPAAHGPLRPRRRCQTGGGRSGERRVSTEQELRERLRKIEALNAALGVYLAEVTARIIRAEVHRETAEAEERAEAARPP